MSAHCPGCTASRELLDEERAEHARTMEQVNALVAALRGTSQHLDCDDGELCWCPYIRLKGEAHTTSCVNARAALARVEGKERA